MNDLWCAGCRMDGDLVSAIVKIQGVPFCNACRDRFRGMAEVLQTVIDWHFKNPLPSDDSRIERYGDTEMQGIPVGPKVTYKCICACGGTVEGAGQLLPGHHAKVLPPDGKPAPPLGYRGGPPVVTSRPATVRAVGPGVVLAQEPAKPIQAPSQPPRKRIKPEPEEDIVSRLDDVLAEAPEPMEDEEEFVTKTGKGDPLLKVLPNLEVAVQLMQAGKNDRQIAKELKIIPWRFAQSPAWTAVKKEARQSANAEIAVLEDRAEAVSRPKPKRRPAVVPPRSIPSAAPIVLSDSVVIHAPASNGGAKNHVRFIMFDADVSEGNLAEMMSAITNALGMKQA